MKSSNPTSRIPDTLSESRIANKGINSGISLSLYDERSFEQMLDCWMKVRGYEPDEAAAFLEQTNLAPFLSVDDWRSLLSGEKAPSKALANHLAVFLEHEAEELQPQLPSFLAFRHRAIHAFLEATRRHSPILELDEAVYPQLRKPLLDRLFVVSFPAESTACRNKGSEDNTEEEELEKLRAFTKKVIAHIKKTRPQSDEDEILNQLASYWKQWPKEELIEFLRYVDPQANDQDLYAWAENVLNDRAAEGERGDAPTAGSLLRFFRHCAGLTQTELAEKLGLKNYETINRWERNKIIIPPTQLSAIKRALHIDDEEFSYFLQLHGSLPEAEWLKRQPDKIKAGVQLRTLRESAGMNRTQLAKQIGVSVESLKNWEDGDTPINRYKLSALYEALNPPIDAMCELTCLVRKDMEVSSVKWELEHGHADYLSFPALNPAWLAAQPYDKQAGLFLAAYRHSQKLTQTDIGKKVGVTKATIQLWENGKQEILSEYLLPIKEALALDDKKYLHFLEVRQRGFGPAHPKHQQEKEAFQQVFFAAFPALNPEWLAEQPREKRDGLLLAAYREYRDLSQQELGKRIDVPVSEVAEWENGGKPLDRMKLPAIKRALPLTETEYHQLDRFGPLLAAYRKASHMTQGVLGDQIGAEINTIQDWESGRRNIEDGRKILLIKEALKLDEAEYQRLLLARFPALNSNWLAEQFVQKRAGLLLAACWERAGLSQVRLGKILNGGQVTISRWELGENPINKDKLHLLYDILKPSIEEMVSLTCLTHKDVNAEWVRKQLENGHAEYLSFPALNPEWLAEQPKEKRGGLLLAAYREYRGIWQDELAKMLGNLANTTIGNWETGIRKIDPTQLSNIYKSLSLTEDEAVRLVRLVREDCEEEWIRKQLRENKPHNLSFPELDDDWLKQQPNARKAGILLTAYRERSNMSQKAIAKEIEIKSPTLREYEQSKKIIPSAVVNQLISFFHNLPTTQSWFDDHEAERFREICAASNAEIKNLRRMARVESTTVGKILTPRDRLKMGLPEIHTDSLHMPM